VSGEVKGEGGKKGGRKTSDLKRGTLEDEELLKMRNS